jgi:hypothetical protein
LIRWFLTSRRFPEGGLQERHQGSRSDLQGRDEEAVTSSYGCSRPRGASVLSGGGPTTVSCDWSPSGAWVMDQVEARGLGGSPGNVVYRLARRRTARWLTGTDPLGLPVGLDSPRVACVRNRQAIHGGESSTAMLPAQLGAARRCGSASEGRDELESPRLRVLVSVWEGFKGWTCASA